MSYLLKAKTVLFWFVTIAISVVSFRFLALGLEGAFPNMMNHITDRKTVFLLHITASSVALLFGLFQFVPRLRAKMPALHRWTGRFYGSTILIGGLSGLIMAAGIMGDRPVAGSGFGLLAIIWLGVTVQAVRLAIVGRIKEHRHWMIRSYALTLAAVTLRLYLPFFLIAGEMEYAMATNYVAWLCWVPNLLVAEMYLRRR